jgi:hypothetical protein
MLGVRKVEAEDRLEERQYGRNPISQRPKQPQRTCDQCQTIHVQALATVAVALASEVALAATQAVALIVGLAVAKAVALAVALAVAMFASIVQVLARPKVKRLFVEKKCCCQKTCFATPELEKNWGERGRRTKAPEA